MYHLPSSVITARKFLPPCSLITPDFLFQFATFYHLSFITLWLSYISPLCVAGCFCFLFCALLFTLLLSVCLFSCTSFCFVFLLSRSQRMAVFPCTLVCSLLEKIYAFINNTLSGRTICFEIYTPIGGTHTNTHAQTHVRVSSSPLFSFARRFSSAPGKRIDVVAVVVVVVVFVVVIFTETDFHDIVYERVSRRVYAIRAGDW